MGSSTEEPSFTFLSHVLNQPAVRRQPVHGRQVLLCQPPCGLMLLQMYLAIHNATPETVHGQVEFRIVIFDRAYLLSNLDGDSQFLPDFSDKGLLRRLAGLDLPFPSHPCTPRSRAGWRRSCRRRG